MSARLTGLSVQQIRDLAREDAEELLELYWPDRSFPVDPIVIARDMGISVFKAELGEDVSGMIVGDSSGTTIYLDHNQPHNRYRFTCAHEIGHYRDRNDELLAGGAIVDRRSEAGRGSADEIYANEFAASLLMPEKEFRDAVEEGVSVYRISDKFEVSVDAVLLRKAYLRVHS